MADRSILKAVGGYLRAVAAEGVAVEFGVVFGSSATGTADEWSDIDLLVVSPRFDPLPTREDVDLLWRIAARIDSRIEPVPCGRRRWREDDASMILELARRHGQRVTLQGDVSAA
jgi:predicted nucleotidyltransferase